MRAVLMNETAVRSRFSVYAKMEGAPEVAVHGQVATKLHIVELILDLMGYTPDSPLIQRRLLDPGCGRGAFILEAARRLVASCRPDDLHKAEAEHALLGVDKDAGAVAACQGRLTEILEKAGVKPHMATRLAKRWIVTDDFLERQFTTDFDFVAGNPPYVRQEAIPKPALATYRDRFSCFYDRADLYVAFFQRGLGLLSPRGTLGFICPDRFARNSYGRKLRGFITEHFGLRTVLDLAQASPFEPEVICYPGIFIIDRSRENKSVDYFRLERADPTECEQVRTLLNSLGRAGDTAGRVTYHRYETWFSGEDQWAVASPAHTALLRKLEESAVSLGSDASGTDVGIGVATGADSVFIVERDEIDIEPQLLVPLVTTRDVASGRVNWSHHYVINPFAGGNTDSLIDLEKFPKARRYFLQHEERLRARNVGKRNPDRWYRTIDRIYPALQGRPKLLIPDIKNRSIVAYEKGELYPHHNLYYVTSEYWDLLALRTVLRSSVARFFVWMYGVKMRGGFLRFQAQYLRKICLPPLMNVEPRLLRRLKDLDGEEDQTVIDLAVAELYDLTDADITVIQDAVGT